jgi:hypothetical protein
MRIRFFLQPRAGHTLSYRVEVKAMNATIGDGLSALALAGGIVGYVYVTHQSRQKKVEIIHQERMAAMDKGIPLPEFPMDPAQEQREASANVIPILGTVLLSLSVGAMIVLYLNLPAASRAFWVSPLPFSFLGVGLIAFHFLTRGPRR